MAPPELLGGILTWAEWERMYERIVADFGFDPAADRAGRDELAAQVGARALRPAQLPSLADETVAIVGAAPSLSPTAVRSAPVDTIIAASGAAAVLTGADVSVDMVVTDLDGSPATAAWLSQLGHPVVVHAHGDNRPQLRRWLPSIATEHCLPTTQVRPRGPVVNAGGFTDGDRAAFLACGLGAAELTFPGWDFDDPSVGPAKRRKLAWAERLLHWLERRRGDRFPILAGRRADIDLGDLPAP